MTESSFGIQYHDKKNWIIDIDPETTSVILTVPKQDQYEYTQFLFILRCMAYFIAWLDANLADIEKNVSEQFAKSKEKENSSEPSPNL